MLRSLLHHAVLVSLVLASAVAAQNVGLVRSDRQPADSLDGAPFVTSEAWAIGDGKTGAVLYGSDELSRRPMASTTKIMTALLVLRVAAKDARVMAETVTVSRFAGNTAGSSARLRPGDKVSVGQLLYGLLLPSGNDAANALAEHCGGRFLPPADVKTIPWTSRSAGRSKEWVCFVAEMNREAARLELKNTRYVNPHGLDDPLHYSCARDLFVLARAAMALPEFRQRVNTLEFQGSLVTAAGSRRTETWTNTNRLLKIAGYDGVKTGTTSNAGACLVSRAVRGDETLFVVVLNAARQGGRYVDTRNLFRWGFNQRLAGGK